MRARATHRTPRTPWLRLGLAAALSLVASFAASAAQAGEPDIYGLGSRAAAMGGAMAADATDFSGNYYNPAALVGARGVSISVGYMHAWNHLAIDGKDTGVSDARGLYGGLVAPGKVLGIPFAFGVGTFIPDVGLSTVNALEQQTPRWALYDGRSNILFLAANLAVRPLEWLEIGGGLAFLAATQGTFDISGTANIVNPYASHLRDEVQADLTAIRYPQAGARFRIGDLGYIGFTYRGETKLKLSISAHLAGDIDFIGIEIPLLYNLATNTIDAFLPQQAVLGFSFQKVRHLKVNFDLAYVNWAAYESPTAQTTAHLAVALPPGLPIVLPADPKPTQVIAPLFQDRFVPRVGVEYVVPAAGSLRKVSGGEELHRLIEIPLRAGYAYEQSPVPPQTGVTNFVDADRHTVSIGAGVNVNAPGQVLRGSLRWDVHGQYSALPTRVTLKDNPADFVGDYRAGGSMFALGSTLTTEF